MSASAEPVRLPSHAQMAWPALRTLQAAGGPLSNKEMEAAVAELLGLTEAQRRLKKSKSGGGSRTMLDYKLAWSRTLLKNMGAITNTKPATWTLTKEGETATEADVARQTQAMLDRLQETNRAKAEAKRLVAEDPR